MFFVPDAQKEAIEKSFKDENIFYKLIGRVLEKTENPKLIVKEKLI